MQAAPNLSGRVAIVTGSARRTGRTIALKLAEAGASVVINARSAQVEAQDVVEEIESIPGNYGHFYKVVELAITTGGPMPVSNSDALLVASIIDQARKIGTRAF